MLVEAKDVDRRIDYNYFFNSRTKRRTPAVLREITHLLSRMPHDTITFAVGVPNTETFPFKAFEVRLKDDTTFTIQGAELGAALQYLPSVGYEPLIKWLYKLQDKIHGKQDWDKTGVIITGGNQDGLYNAMVLCLEEGDTVLLQHPVYPSALEIARPYNPHFIKIPQDKDGMRPDILKEKLDQAIKENRRKPKLLYVNPSGSNPTGIILSSERKAEIYDIACEHNLLILEDDPYYFLNFSKEFPESFLSMDREGRVLRFDSFSKILSSGLRIGYATGPIELLRKMELRMQVSTLHSSALSQIIMNRMFETWGMDGLMKHFEQIQDFYAKRRDYMIAAVEKHLADVAEWNVPTGGMFLWLRIKFLEDSYELAMKECVNNSILVVPGHPFVSQENVESCQYLRMSFSVATPEEMDEGCRRLGAIIRAQMKKK